MFVKRLLTLFLSFLITIAGWSQINTDRVMAIGRNALYFEDYVLSIQYFNQVIGARPYLYEPYFYRGLAKFYLEDYTGAEQDCTEALERNPFVTRKQLKIIFRHWSMLQNSKDCIRIWLFVKCLILTMLMQTSMSMK